MPQSIRKHMSAFTKPFSLCFMTMVLLSFVGLAGCGGDKSNDSDEQGRSNAPARVISLNVLVIEDKKIGAIVERQYSSRRNGKVTLTEMTWDELSQQEYQAVDENDVVIYPANGLGDLATRNKLEALTKDNLPSDATNRRSILFSDKDLAVSWGEQEVAMSLGQSHWMMLCRKDALKAVGFEAPETWKQFQRLAKKLRGLPADYSGPRNIGVPLSKQWAGHVLVLRAAAAIRLPGKYSSYFDVDSMQPLIAAAPFQESLQSWQEDLTAAGANKVVPQNPSEVFSDYANGKLAVAIVPLNKYWSVGNKDADFPETQLSSVPARASYYDRSQDLWKRHSEASIRPVPLTQTTGMLCSVSATSQKTRDSIDLIAWLSSKSISSIVAIESPNAGVSLKNHLGNPSKWLGDSLPTENATEYSNVLFDQNENNQSLNALRIPGYQRYNSDLSDAVRAVIVDGVSADAALSKAVEQWKAITAELGEDNQKQAYRNSEGLR